MLTAGLIFAVGQCLLASTVTLAEPNPPSWTTSARMGVGIASEQTFGLFLPRLGLKGDLAELKVTMPFWLKLGDSDESTILGRKWDSVHTYLSMIEKFLLTNQSGNVTLSMGTLHQESLGSGVLLDDYSSGWNPLARKLGVTSQVRLGGVEVSGLINQIEDPYLFALGAQVRPLWWIGDADAQRFVLSAELVVDRAAPTLVDEKALWAGDLGARLVFHSGQFLQVEGILSGVLLHEGRFGAHLALLVEWLENAPLPGDSVAVQLDLIRAWAGYEPSYFGPLYDVQRYFALEDSESNFNSILRIDSKNGNLRYGGKSTLNFQGKVGFDLYTQWLTEKWSMMVLLHQSSITALREIGGDSSVFWAEAELAVALYRQFYTYGHFVRGWHFPDKRGPTPLTLWTLGVGMHFGGMLSARN